VGILREGPDPLAVLVTVYIGGMVEKGDLPLTVNCRTQKKKKRKKKPKISLKTAARSPLKKIKQSGRRQLYLAVKGWIRCGRCKKMPLDSSKTCVTS